MMSQMDFTLQQAKAFLTVARFCSFTHAAQILHVSQPALTVQVQQLEESLNLRLFDRGTRRVILTAAGRELVPMLQTLILEHEAIMANARDLAASRQGTIRLACVPSIATTYLPEAISRFRERHTNVAFDLRDVNGQRVVAMVREEEVEFGITNIDQKWPDLDVTGLYQEEIHAVFPKSHPIAELKEITLEDVAQYPLILLGTEFNSRVILETAFIAAGQLVKPICEPKCTSTAIGMVRAGLGIALLGSLVIAASNLYCFPQLCSRPLYSPSLTLSINLIRKTGRSLSPATQAFIDLLFEYNKEGHWTDPLWTRTRGLSETLNNVPS
jgi:DNA-binding transcriptional LysR family regulator